MWPKTEPSVSCSPWPLPSFLPTFNPSPHPVLGSFLNPPFPLDLHHQVQPHPHPVLTSCPHASCTPAPAVARKAYVSRCSEAVCSSPVPRPSPAQPSTAPSRFVMPFQFSFHPPEGQALPSQGLRESHSLCSGVCSSLTLLPAEHLLTQDIYSDVTSLGKPFHPPGWVKLPPLTHKPLFISFLALKTVVI